LLLALASYFLRGNHPFGLVPSGKRKYPILLTTSRAVNKVGYKQKRFEVSFVAFCLARDINAYQKERRFV
jgi:hypothetical protein